jgi:hypothetical protein
MARPATRTIIYRFGPFAACLCSLAVAALAMSGCGTTTGQTAAQAFNDTSAKASSAAPPSAAAPTTTLPSSTTTETVPTTPAASPPFRFFSTTSFWNMPVPTDATLDPNSTALVQTLDATVAAEQLTQKGPWINTTSYSVPIYTVPANQPTVPVQLGRATSRANRGLQAAWRAVPLPADAQPAPGTDALLVVWQPSTDRLWEFWRLQHTPAGWEASWGGAMQNVSSSSGVYTTHAWPGARSFWGAAATSLSIASGLISLEDIEHGEINHALAMTIPNGRAGIYASPAERTDGKSTNPLALPEGAHLRLNPNLNLASLHLPPLTKLIAEAAQHYGIFIRGRSQVVTFDAENPLPTGKDPYSGTTGYFEGKTPEQLLASFPWSELQVLKLELHHNQSRPIRRHHIKRRGGRRRRG